MRPAPFTRPTLIAAVELLEDLSQARFNQMVLRLGLEEEITSSASLSVAAKCDLLGRILVQRTSIVLAHPSQRPFGQYPIELIKLTCALGPLRF